MKPKYYVSYKDEGGVTCDMLYAVYPNRPITNYVEPGQVYYQTCNGWQMSGNTAEWLMRQDYMHPCSLSDVRAHFDNVKAHKLDNYTVALP